MAIISDTYLVLNDLVKQTEGKTGISNVDVTDTVSFGKKLLSSESDGSKDVVFKALIDRIGKTIIDMLEYDGEFKNVFKDAFAYGSVLQTIHVAQFEAKKSGVYDNLEDGDVDTDIYKVYLPKVDQTLFENIQPWEFAVTITDKQIETAFLNAESVAGFINGIFIAMKNSITDYLDTCARTCYENLIVADINKGGNVAINPLQMYYEETGIILDEVSYQYNAEFLRWLTSLFTDKIKLLSKLTVLFNHKDYETHTPRSMCHFVINSKIADNIKRFMTSNVYNDELVSMPLYDEISSWQGVGEDASLDERLTVNAKYKDENGNYVNANKKILAVIHDDRVMSMTLKDRRTVTKINEHGARRNVWEQGTVCNFVNLGHNSIVFYIDSVRLPVINSVTVSNETGTIFGTAITSMQTGLTVNNESKTITGTLKKLTTGAIPDVWGAGYFMALKFTLDGDLTPEDVSVSMYPTVSSGFVHLDSDLNGTFKVTDKNVQKFAVRVGNIIKYYDLSGLTLQS